MAARFRSLDERYLFPILALLAIVLSFALQINKLGFYWDDWPMVWIGSVLGPDALRQYFSTNRPYIGEINLFLLRIIGDQPLPWHLLMLVIQWVNGLLLWYLLRLLLPGKSWLAVLISLLFLVYPGPVQHYIAFVYSPFYLMLTALLASLYCSVKALMVPERGLLWTAAALALAFINMFALDYFFLLELIRPLILLMALRTLPDRSRWLPRLIKVWAPYLALALVMVYWRVFLFPYQTQNYDPVWLEQLRVDPLSGLMALGKTVIDSLVLAIAGVWVLVFLPESPAVIGRRVFILALLVAAAMALAIITYLWLTRRPNGKGDPTEGRGNMALLAFTGLAGMLLAGIPFWMIDLPLNLGFPSSRALMPFTLGASLLLGGLIGLFPLPRWSRAVVLIVLIALAGAWQYRVADTFRRDWALQSAMFWQLSWRAPALQPDTTLLFNELPLFYPTDNSLTAPLNWIYSHADGAQGMRYLLYYPSLRLGTGLPALQPGLPVRQDYLGAAFSGSTDQLLSVTFDPPACLHVLDPLTAQPNIMIPQELRAAAAIANLDVISAEPPVSPQSLFGEEPARGWCYYYQKADLARQLGDWEEVVRLGEQAFALDDHPNDPMERLPFIEGYAMTGDWQRANALTTETLAVTEIMRPVLCQLWDRITAETGTTLEAVLEQELNCH